MRLFQVVGVCLVLSGFAFGNETIVVRSGSVGGNPGVPGMAIDNGNCIAAPTANIALSNVAFTTEFQSACAGAAPYVVTPNSQWISSLVCDPEARWINSEVFPGNDPDARSTLYCFPFTVQTANICEATIQFCWAGDDSLGDPSGPNKPGVYVNGTALNGPFAGGSYATQSMAVQTITSLVSPGLNYLYVYQRDLGGVASGILFSATIDVSTVSICQPGIADSVLVIASGQYQGAPQIPGGPVDNVVCVPNGMHSVPYQATFMSPAQVEAVCQNGVAPFAITPFFPDWVQTLSCNANARWIHSSLGILDTGQPAQSVIYCIPFQLPSTLPLEYCMVQLELCWAADDSLGDPLGPNYPGAFINGLPLPPQFWGGSYGTETTASTDITSMVLPGQNHLQLYQRDIGNSFSGVIYNATITITPPTCGPSGIGTSICDPAELNSTGQYGVIHALGSSTIQDANFHLEAVSLPLNEFGIFICGTAPGFLAHPGGSQGNICFGGSLGRYNLYSQLQNTGAAGWMGMQVDLTDMPINPHVPVLAGQTWYFQAWYRDHNPNSTSNFTTTTAVTF